MNTLKFPTNRACPVDHLVTIRGLMLTLRRIEKVCEDPETEARDIHDSLISVQSSVKDILDWSRRPNQWEFPERPTSSKDTPMATMPVHVYICSLTPASVDPEELSRLYRALGYAINNMALYLEGRIVTHSKKKPKGASHPRPAGMGIKSFRQPRPASGIKTSLLDKAYERHRLQTEKEKFRDEMRARRLEEIADQSRLDFCTEKIVDNKKRKYTGPEEPEEGSSSRLPPSHPDSRESKRAAESSGKKGVFIPIDDDESSDESTSQVIGTPKDI